MTDDKKKLEDLLEAVRKFLLEVRDVGYNNGCGCCSNTKLVDDEYFKKLEDTFYAAE